MSICLYQVIMAKELQDQSLYFRGSQKREKLPDYYFIRYICGEWKYANWQFLAAVLNGPSAVGLKGKHLRSGMEAMLT
jgi:hypothetical protein